LIGDIRLHPFDFLFAVSNSYQRLLEFLSALEIFWANCAVVCPLLASLQADKAPFTHFGQDCWAFRDLMRDRDGLDLSMICSLDGKVVRNLSVAHRILPETIQHLIMLSVFAFPRSRPTGQSCVRRALGFATPFVEAAWLE
jgi:hypothetical protein